MTFRKHRVNEWIFCQGEQLETHRFVLLLCRGEVELSVADISVPGRVTSQESGLGANFPFMRIGPGELISSHADLTLHQTSHLRHDMSAKAVTPCIVGVLSKTTVVAELLATRKSKRQDPLMQLSTGKSAFEIARASCLVPPKADAVAVMRDGQAHWQAYKRALMHDVSSSLGMPPITQGGIRFRTQTGGSVEFPSVTQPRTYSTPLQCSTFISKTPEHPSSSNLCFWARVTVGYCYCACC